MQNRDFHKIVNNAFHIFDAYCVSSFVSSSRKIVCISQVVADILRGWHWAFIDANGNFTFQLQSGCIHRWKQKSSERKLLWIIDRGEPFGVACGFQWSVHASLK